MAVAQSVPKLKVAVVHPCDQPSLGAVFEAVELGLIEPVLVGPQTKIAAAAAALGKDISKMRIVDVPHSHAAAEKAVELVKAGEAEALMKGSLHTDELMAPSSAARAACARSADQSLLRHGRARP